MICYKIFACIVVKYYSLILPCFYMFLLPTDLVVCSSCIVHFWRLCPSISVVIHQLSVEEERERGIEDDAQAFKRGNVHAETT